MFQSKRNLIGNSGRASSAGKDDMQMNMGKKCGGERTGGWREKMPCFYKKKCILDAASELLGSSVRQSSQNINCNRCNDYPGSNW